MAPYVYPINNWQGVPSFITSSGYPINDWQWVTHHWIYKFNLWVIKISLPTSGPLTLITFKRGWQCRFGRDLWPVQSSGEDSGHMVHGDQPAPSNGVLQHGEQDLPLHGGHSTVLLWLWPLLYNISVLKSECK